MAAAWSRFLLPLELSIPHGAGSPAPRIIRGELLAVQPQVCNGMLYIIMEAASTDLLQLVQREGKLPCAPEARDIRRPVVGRGDKPPQNRTLVHRVDLKCGRRRVAHFPAARHGQSEPDFGFVRIGGMAYASPEVLMGIPYDAKKYDVWSLGIMLYVMITGSMPFDDTHIHSMPCHQKRGPVFSKSPANLAEALQNAFVGVLSVQSLDPASVRRTSHGGHWLKGDL
ncbi:testis-specific serine/threonine-protein kinase 6-like [Sphaerodactylus townsendi]|uniref:testis-specific serine/threonine-protein kinase 6-like n=1 Tax=Sphaerodactylus townsendi TaxID=933632 RepID=UPI002025FC64|nr:testis-specific serine/threonine-protein kinase 6-like [Sphaerodactylus townsendi]